MNNVHKPSLRVWVKPTATFPHFAQPTVVGYFSLDQDRRFTPDTTQLRYMYLPRDADGLSWDLNHGLESVQRSDHAKSIERIDNLLRGLLASGLAINPEVASIICLRGLLTRVMTTPYEQNQGWEILVSKFRGVLFMCAQETPEQRRERMGQNDRQKRFSSWGFKFEQYMTTDQPGCPPDIEMPVKEGEEFCCLFRTKLNDRRLVYGAEMDAVTSDVPLEDCLEDVMLSEFIELKTSRKSECVRQERNFKRFKLLNWWAQNFLVNVAHIICGFRDDRGIIENIAFYKVEEIPKMARDLWVPAVCMTFLDQFLSYVGKTVRDCPQSNDPNTVWRFRWEPGVHFVTSDVISGRSQFSFLPEWFMSSVMAMESHPLDYRIRIYSSRHGKNTSNDDLHTHTAKVLDMAKAIALQRAKSVRSPSPRSIMSCQQNSKMPSKQAVGSSTQTNAASSSVTAGALANANPSGTCDLNANQTSDVVGDPSSASSATNVPDSSSSNNPIATVPSRPRSRPRSHRRRARGDRFPHLQPSPAQKKGTKIHEQSSSSQRKNFNVPKSTSVGHPITMVEPAPICTSSTSPLIISTSDYFDVNSSEQSSFSSEALSPGNLSHTEEIVYTSAYSSLEDGAFLVPHPSSELSPSTSMDQFTSQSFLTSSPPGDTYTLLPSALSSTSLMADCYSSHAFSVCDDLPQATYLMSPNQEFIHQQSYMQSTSPLGNFSSSAANEFLSPSSFLPIDSSDEVHSSQVYLHDTSKTLNASSVLSPVASISHTYLSSPSTDMSSEEIQTAEGSLTTINQLSSSSYHPSASSVDHLTLQVASQP